MCGVPHGWALGPILFVYVYRRSNFGDWKPWPVAHTHYSCWRHSFVRLMSAVCCWHVYSKVSECVEAADNIRMRSNSFQPNPVKTVSFVMYDRCYYQLPTSLLLIDGCFVSSRREHLCRLRLFHDCVTNSITVICLSTSTTTDVSRSVPTSTLQMLLAALAHCRLDYDNAILVGLPAYPHVTRPQSLWNAAARLIYRLIFTDAFVSLHLTGQEFQSISSCTRWHCWAYKVLIDTALC